MTRHSLQRSALARRPGRELFGLEHTREVVEEIFGEQVHLAVVRSVANGVCGVLNAVMASVAAIGRAYAELAGIREKSGIKQVDRLLSNDGVVLSEVMALWVRHVVGQTPSIVVAMDWTDFDDDDHTTLCVSLITTHGRATPLAWKTVKKSKLKRQRTRHELQMVKDLRQWLPEHVSVHWLADRAFGYCELYELLASYGWHYTIRFRENIKVYERDDALCLPASAYVPENGRVRKVLNAQLTHKRFEVPAAVFVKRKGMKQAWCLVSSRADADAHDIVHAYSKRFTIEETFRDTKNITFGMGLSATHVRGPERRDRLLLMIAIAQTLLTLLGVASEASGLDRTLKANTVKTRTLSLFNQGLRWYARIRRGTLRQDDAELLLPHYERILRQHEFLGEILRFDG
jgi:Transposase DDE domain